LRRTIRLCSNPVAILLGNRKRHPRNLVALNMTSTVEEPSQAEKLTDIADAGPGASDKNGTDELSEKPLNGTANGDPNGASTDASLESGAGPSPKAEETPTQPERSALKVGLIMGSICVRTVLLHSLEDSALTDDVLRSLYSWPRSTL